MINKGRGIIRLAAICALAIGLTGCSFHIRNPHNIPPQLHTLFIADQTTQGDLQPLLVNDLQQLGVHIVATPQAAPVTLVIQQENFSQTHTALGTAQQINNAGLIYSVTVILQDAHGNPLAPPATFTSNASDLQNTNQLLGDMAGQAQLQQTLLMDMAEKILFYLDAQQTRAHLVAIHAPVS